MNDSFITEFYARVILPQFELDESAISWGPPKQLGPDEASFAFTIKDSKYILIYEDAGGAASTPQYIRDTLKLNEGQFSYILPIASEYSPSLKLRFGNSSKHIEYVTGAFTVISVNQ